MGAILTIDSGNTKVKLSVYGSTDAPLCQCVCDEPDLQLLSTLIEDYDVESGAMCSVRHTDARMLETLRRMLPGGLLVVTSDVDVPIPVHYGTPHTLGADRVVAACGASAIYPHTPIVVADAGTALTIDFVSPQSGFVGGNISAGVRMRLHSLHSYTDMLPAISITGPLPAFGTDTDTALRCGALRGTASEIEMAWRTFCHTYPDARLILTGGDAEALLPLLPTETLLQPDLISKGLISILKYNEYI